MNILHFINDSDPDGLSFSFLNDLLEGNDGIMSNYILAFPNAVNYMNVPNERVKILSKHIWKLHKNRKRFRGIIESEKIDIIHIHSLSNIWAWIVFRWAMEERRPVVLSTYKYFFDWNFSHRYLSIKLPAMLFAFRKMLKGTVAIHAVTEQEKVKMNRLPFVGESLDNKIVFIPSSSMSGSGIDCTIVSSMMVNLYRQVADSKPFWLMTDDDIRIENSLLQYGACLADSDKYGMKLSDAFGRISEELHNLPKEDHRRIQLHCYDQGVLPLFAIAVQSWNPDYKILDPDKIARFTKPQKIEYLETTRAWIRVSRTKQMFDSYPQSRVEKKICIMLLNVKHLIDKRKLSRKNLADLYSVLRFEEYDEYKLESMLDDIGMKKFASRIFCVMNATMNLSEGFIPFEMKNDRKTKNILINLFKSDVL